jgi:hypothetical protein
MSLSKKSNDWRSKGKKYEFLTSGPAVGVRNGFVDTQVLQLSLAPQFHLAVDILAITVDYNIFKFDQDGNSVDSGGRRTWDQRHRLAIREVSSIWASSKVPNVEFTITIEETR